MSKLTKLAALVIAAALAVACGDTPTDVEGQRFAPTFNQGGQGQGAQFVDNLFIGVTHTDPDGDHCLSLVDPPTDDINDFVRTDPKGKVFVHIADQPATVTVTTAAGVVWSGTGKLNVNTYLFSAQFQYQSTAPVSDAAGNAARAVCKFISGPNGNVGTNTVDLR
jgi:hypothetical protein